MLAKYKNIKDDYFVSESAHESTIKPNRYIMEAWGFDGLHFKKTTVDESKSDVKIPEAKFSIEEFLAYVDELVRLRDYLLVFRPKTREPTS
jgi:hypothetical protein